jgi:hypothetical protein
MPKKYLKKTKKRGGSTNTNDLFSTPTSSNLSVQGPLFINPSPIIDEQTPSSFGSPLSLGDLSVPSTGPLSLGDLSVPSTLTTVPVDSPGSFYSGNTTLTNNSLPPINLHNQFMIVEDEEEEEEDPDTDVEEMNGGNNEMSIKTLKYCPYMSISKDGRYASITKNRPHKLDFNGKKYRFYTCCQHCCKELIKHAKENPKSFADIYIDHIDGKKLYLKHRQNGKIVQIANEISSSTKKNRKNKTKKRMVKKLGKTRKIRKMKKKQKGGVHYKTNIRWGNGYGANCNDPNNNIYNTNLLKLWPYKS